MKKYFYRCSGALLAAALLAGTLSSCKGGDSVKDNWTYSQQAPTAESLLNEGEKQNRYLSIPDSRIVLNPFNFESQARETTQSMYSNRPTMALNFGFCDPYMGEGRGTEISNVLMMAEKTSEGSGSSETVWEANLENSATWQFSGSQGTDYDVKFNGDSAELTVKDGAEVAWQHMESTVVTDIENAYLTITLNSISKAGGTIGVKVNAGGGSDIMLLQTNAVGTYSIDLAEATGWTGTKQFSVKVFSVAKGNTISFSNLKIQKGEKIYSDAVEYSTNWRPDQLGFKASYADGLEVSGKDFFYDEKTVVRTVEGAGSGFMVYGEYSGVGSVDGSTVLVSRENFKYAITASGDVKPRFYSSVVEALSGSEGSEQPSGDSYGVWAYVLESAPENGKWNIAVAFDTKDVADADVMALSRKPGAGCDEALASRTAAWDEMLAKVPRPTNFEIQTVDAMGVTADDVKQSYYEAWVQVISNALPASPEIGFNYRSFAAGKASLWAYGDPHCRYTATWDSLYGIQYYVQINPDAAWEMYRGLMSLVDDDGMIAGESLPSNNARVAWMLYTAKPDKEALAEVQPELEKHLQWRYANPRWIYGESTPDPFEKDMAFVSSALIDVEYLKRINTELGLDESLNTDWDGRSEKLYKNMKMWFFSPVTEYPVEYFSLSGNRRTPGNASWVTKALHIPNVKEEEISELMRLFESFYNTTKPFCGLGPVKYEEYNYTLLGLVEHGYMDEGRTLAETTVRDITRSGIHSEGYCYQPTDTIPLPEGVKPSMFGAAMLIDNVYMMNGVRMDDGMPVFSNYFSYDGGMENFKVDGKTFNVKKEGNTYTYGGSYVGEEKTMEVEADTVGIPYEGTNVHPLQY